MNRTIDRRSVRYFLFLVDPPRFRFFYQPTFRDCYLFKKWRVKFLVSLQPPLSFSFFHLERRQGGCSIRWKGENIGVTFQNWWKNPLLSRLSGKLVINRAPSRETRIKLDSEKKRRFNEVFVDPEHQMPRKVRRSFLPTTFLPRIIGRKKRKKSGFYVRRLTMIRATSANISLTRQKRILPVSRGNTRLPKICVAIDNFKSRCAKAICPTTFSANDH